MSLIIYNVQLVVYYSQNESEGMKYTLYIDESGDFETQKGQWVLSGVLFANTYEICEKFLQSKMNRLPSELNIESINDFHLTEFRRDYGHDQAVRLARKTLDRLHTLPFDSHFLASINYTKSSLSIREKTYRLMLSDILALCETVLPDNEVIEHLDLIVATRTIDGKRQTNISDINDKIINSLPVALEVDLATKGLVNLIGKHINVKMDYANNSWGLICADFIANLTYHNRKELENNLLQELEEQGAYSLFESFGGFETRRANTAERDQDYVLALFRWLVISLEPSKQEQANIAIQRLLLKFFSKRGTSGHRASFEALIEKLWRNYNSPHLYQQLSSILVFFEKELELFLSQLKQPHYVILFRLRNFIMMLENHIGDAVRLNALVDNQNHIIKQLASNPEYFQMILDFKTHEIETSINNLDLEKAYILAQKYHAMIANYKECWKLLIDQDELELFDSSRANIKSEMILIRCSVLAAGLKLRVLPDDIDEKINEISHLISHPLDVSRLNNYKIMYLLKQRNSLEAVNFSLDVFSSISNKSLHYFDLLWFMKALNDAVLAATITNINELILIVDFQYAQLDSTQKGHPMDLLWRELALFELIAKKDKSAARKNIRKSKNSFTLGNSQIVHWLLIVLDIHADYISNRLKSQKEYFVDLDNKDFIESLNKLANMTFIEKVRFISPY